MDDKTVEKIARENVRPIGTKGLNRWGGYVYEEFLTELRHPQACKIYKEMSSNDATIGAILYMAEQLIRRARWNVVPASSKPEDIEAAEFLEECMHDMEETWAETITEILSMLVYGYSYHETIYKIRRGKHKNGKFNSKFNDGKIGWRSLPVRSQQTLDRWEFDESTGRLKGMWQLAPPNYNLVFIPIEKSLLFRTRASRGNPEGRSLLRTAYRAWYFKKHIEEIEGIGIERDLAGLPVLTPDENTDIWDAEDPVAVLKRNAAETLVRNIRRDQSEGIVLPYGWELELLNSGGNRQFDTNQILNRYDQRIAITMLADIVMLGADKVGSFALANVKKSLLAASLEAQLKNIADTFNKYAIPRLFELNQAHFGALEQYPTLKPEEIETPDVKELAFFLKYASESGMSLFPDFELENYLRRVLSMPEVTEEAFEERQQEREKRLEEQDKQKELEQKLMEQENNNSPEPEVDNKDEDESEGDG